MRFIYVRFFLYLFTTLCSIPKSASDKCLVVVSTIYVHLPIIKLHRIMHVLQTNTPMPSDFAILNRYRQYRRCRGLRRGQRAELESPSVECGSTLLATTILPSTLRSSTNTSTSTIPRLPPYVRRLTALIAATLGQYANTSNMKSEDTRMERRPILCRQAGACTHSYVARSLYNH